MTTLRPYQEGAINATFDYWRGGGDSPLVVMATGTGKSVVVAEINRRICTHWPDMRILNLVHVQELVEQNYLELRALYPEANAGIYSAGLGKRDSHHRITFASIQSVYKKADLLGPRDLILVDEAHLIPHDSEGMYRTLIGGLKAKRPDMRVAGLTATPFRLSSGRIDRGAGALFTDTVFNYGIAEGIRDGYLSPLTCRGGSLEIDVSSVARRGGEFVAGALEEAANKDEIVRQAALEIAERGASRRGWLAFCSGVNHAHAVAEALRGLGVTAACVTGATPKEERKRIISDFKAGRIRALTNAQVLTTGFNAPHTDLIAFLRPTLSTGLYIQMVGRGTRKADGKDNCLILDFAGNVRRHGPVDAVEDSIGNEKAGGRDMAKTSVDAIRAKACPQCETLIAVQSRRCETCGYEYPKPEVTPKHEAAPDRDAAILSSELFEKLGKDVTAWRAFKHTKADGIGPATLRVEYLAGMMTYREWVCFEHTGFARTKAERWWRQHRGDSPIPAGIDEALERFETLERPARIAVQANGKFFEIVGRDFTRPDEMEAA
jgi:DNA repair protein RadD